mmetsp:Transcript_2467/g.3222  ORF Transcript_2467/g.3222 Transcript_2467/m.3222 type:complete len:223 (-) Transcript_2467:8-676(-)
MLVPLLKYLIKLPKLVEFEILLTSSLIFLVFLLDFYLIHVKKLLKMNSMSLIVNSVPSVLNQLYLMMLFLMRSNLLLVNIWIVVFLPKFFLPLSGIVSVLKNAQNNLLLKKKVLSLLNPLLLLLKFFSFFFNFSLVVVVSHFLFPPPGLFFMTGGRNKIKFSFLLLVLSVLSNNNTRCLGNISLLINFFCFVCNKFPLLSFTTNCYTIIKELRFLSTLCFRL